jgi:hypothetical protein
MHILPVFDGAVSGNKTATLKNNPNFAPQKPYPLWSEGRRAAVSHFERHLKRVPLFF